MAISEDIKIVKNYLDDFKDEERGLYIEWHRYTTIEEIKAIENILHRYEELEKENAELKAMLKNRIRYTQELEQDLFENCSNYVVPKSVIREKIEEIQKLYEEALKKSDFKEVEIMNHNNFKGIQLEGQRTILKELLGEEI